MLGVRENKNAYIEKQKDHKFYRDYVFGAERDGRGRGKGKIKKK